MHNKKKEVKKIAIEIGRYSLILFFLYYYIGITAFVHTHRIANYTITHSHPFLPSSQHSHTTAEYETLSFLNMLIAESTPFFAIVLFCAVIEIIHQHNHLSTYRRRLFLPLFRGPPFTVLCI